MAGITIVQNHGLFLHDLADSHPRSDGKGVKWGTKLEPVEGGGREMTTDALTRLSAAVDRHTCGDGAHDTPVPELLLARRSVPSDFEAVTYAASLCVVTQGVKEVRLAGETFRYDPAHSLLVSVDVPATARVVEASPSVPCLAVRVTLDPAVVNELLAGGNNPMRPGPSARALGVERVDPPLLDAVARLVSLLDTPADVSALAPLVLREITYRVLTGPHGPRLRQISAAGAPAQRVARAVRWLTEHFAEPLRVRDLARHVGMSPSALHMHFKSVTTLSPLQYQKRLRLQEARRLMLGQGLDAAEASFRVGYESPSQFGREYRRMFGESPRRDVAALRLETQPT